MSAERKALSSVLETRGERDEERRADEGGSDKEEEEEEEDGGSEYLSLFSVSLFLSPSVCGASLWHTSVMRKTPPACLVSGR